MPKKAGNRKLDWRGLIRLLTIGVSVAAVVKELRLPAEERTWYGTIGFVPYDFRTPSVERVRERIWQPDSPQLLVPTVYGVGWTVNIGRIIALLRRSTGSDG